MNRNFFRLLLSAVLMMCCMSVWAETKTVSYLYPVYNTDGDATSGIKEWKTGEVNATVVTSSSSTLSAGWYVVTDNVQTGPLTCNGEVHLILADGAILTATRDEDEDEDEDEYEGQAGITVTDNNSLSVYGQTAQSGQLMAIGGDYAAGIGGGTEQNGSNITINGGTVTANGGAYAAGIGGGSSGSASNITINGGTVTANGGEYAAGIGGGSSGRAYDITINGGTVTANGGEDAAGIGSGSSGSASNITINGGTVTANGGVNGAGIGTGLVTVRYNIYYSNITINGGVVTATGGDNAAGIGGGINGSGSNININGGKVTANGGKDVYYENSSSSGIGNGCGASLDNIYSKNIFVTTDLIVRADYKNPPTTVRAANRTATTDIASELDGQRYATINRPQTSVVVTYDDNITVYPQFTSGDKVDTYTPVTFIAANRTKDNYEFVGFYKESTFENKITDGKINGRTYTVEMLDCDISVYAKYEQFTRTPIHYIDADGQEQLVSPTEITNSTTTLKEGWYVVNGADVQTGTLTCNGEVHLILADGAKLTATGGVGKAGIQVSGDGNSLTIYGQTAQSGQLMAIGGNYSAGIGGGTEQNGSNITINGGTVTARATHAGAGIGGGFYGSGSNITINSGIVTSNGAYGAGIGGGPMGSGSNITINGGTVSATGGDGAAGIGGGDKRDGSNITLNDGTVTANGGIYGAGIGGGNQASGFHIIINGGTVKASGGDNAAGIGGGAEGYGANIRINGDYKVLANNANPPITEITHTSNDDLATILSKQRYVHIVEPTTTLPALKDEAKSAIDETITGVTNADILSIATEAKDKITNANRRDDVTAIKNAALTELKNLIKGLDLGKAEAFGDLGTPQTGCAAVKVTKDDKEVILYAPDKVKVIKIPANK